MLVELSAIPYKIALKRLTQTRSLRMVNHKKTNATKYLQDIIDVHGSIDNYIEIIKEYKEVLTDPNRFLTPTEIRLGRGKPVKVSLIKRLATLNFNSYSGFNQKRKETREDNVRIPSL